MRVRIDSHELEACQSIEQVVKLINKGTCYFDSNELAGQYAYEACQDRDEYQRVDKNEFICHLDYLNDFGARFDSGKVEEWAKGLVK